MNNGTLEIVQVEKGADESAYTCVARNARGKTARSTFYINVIGKFGNGSETVRFTSVRLLIRLKREFENIEAHSRPEQQAVTYVDLGLVDWISLNGFS